MKTRFFYFGLVSSVIFTACGAVQNSSSKAFDNANEVIRYYSGTGNAEDRTQITKSQTNYKNSDNANNNLLGNDSIIWKATNTSNMKEEDITIDINSSVASETKKLPDNSEKYGIIDVKNIEQELSKPQSTDDIFEGV
jgi:hypothetical protein